jgi:hypothetical protein
MSCFLISLCIHEQSDVAYTPLNYEIITITKCDKREEKIKYEEKSGWPPTLLDLHHRDFALDTRADCLTLRPPTPGTACPINLAK